MGTYVHIPFCHSKCAYCDFYSLPRATDADALVDAIGRELEMRRDEIGESCHSTLYIGGGTPSILTAQQFARLTALLPKVAYGGEFTIEVNPEDVSEEKVRAWVENGVNRVSMGVQSFNDTELIGVGRRHTSHETIKAYRLLRDGGIKNISLDLIYGLPGQSAESWRRNVELMMELKPEHLSAYLLSYEPGTRLYARLISGKVQEAEDELVEEMYQYLCTACRQHGYEHYEISNFALSGHRAVHNSSYWRFEPYLGLGPSAHSFDGQVRRVNGSNLKEYLKTITEGQPYYSIDEETDTDRLNDRIMVGLRTSDGLDLSVLTAEQRAALQERAKAIPKDHLRWTTSDIDRGTERLVIPEEHFLVSDAIIRTLLF